MLNKIYKMIEPAENENSKTSNFYNIIMLICIFMSLATLAVKAESFVCNVVDKITVAIFIFDYILRLITAKYKFKKGIKSYFLFIIEPMAIIDLISILPSVIPINAGFKALRMFRIIRMLKVFRSFKIFRYSKNIERITTVLKKQSKPLTAVLSMAIFYVLFTALVMFNIEPNTFNNFFDAIYWATISLTSVGYGDITPISTFGRLFTMLSAFVGVAIIALPSGIITAGYLDLLKNETNKE